MGGAGWSSFPSWVAFEAPHLENDCPCCLLYKYGEYILYMVPANDVHACESVCVRAHIVYYSESYTVVIVLSCVGRGCPRHQRVRTTAGMIPFPGSSSTPPSVDVRSIAPTPERALSCVAHTNFLLPPTPGLPTPHSPTSSPGFISIWLGAFVSIKREIASWQYNNPRKPPSVPPRFHYQVKTHTRTHCQAAASHPHRGSGGWKSSMQK